MHEHMAIIIIIARLTQNEENAWSLLYLSHVGRRPWKFWSLFLLHVWVTYGETNDLLIIHF